MSKILYIKANVKEDGQSRTFKISDFFVEEYKRLHPNDEVQILDLYKEDINFLSLNDLESIRGKKDGNDKGNKALKYAYEFANADKYIFAAPMWNLSFPAILKTYIDYVAVSGIAFRYTEKGAVGMLDDKKAINITTSGGFHQNTPEEMGDRYLRAILNFFGITDIETLAVEGMDIMGTNIEEKINEGKEKALNSIKNF